MHLGKLGRGLAAMTIIITLSVACTSDPEVPPTPSPSIPATPAETEQERQERVAYAAAEKSYREFRAEYRRVLRAGGSSKATIVLKETAAGPYLAQFVKVVQSYEKTGAKLQGQERVVYVRPAGYSPTSLVLDTCEDGRGHTTRYKNGKVAGKGEVRTARIEVRKIEGRWKMWDVEGEKVASCT